MVMMTLYTRQQKRQIKRIDFWPLWEKARVGIFEKIALMNIVVVVQSLNHVQLFVNPRTAACQASLFFTILPSLLKLMPIELVMPFNRLVL